MTRLSRATRKTIVRLFDRLDYQRLAGIYCEAGGDTFWAARRVTCRNLGLKLAERLLNRLPPHGRSLYVGAGVAEIPILVMETLELEREVAVFNLRTEEVKLLNRACAALPVRFQARDARRAAGSFDHLWIVSVLNDPERFPALSALSYGRANPVTFDPRAFAHERRVVTALAHGCLKKLRPPALITTSAEEIPWITHWCERRAVRYTVEKDRYPTAIVEDPVCFIRVGGG